MFWLSIVYNNFSFWESDTVDATAIFSEWRHSRVKASGIVMSSYRSRVAGVEVQGLPSPDEDRSDFMLFLTMFIFYDKKEAVTRSSLRIYFLWFYAARLNEAGDIRIRICHSGLTVLSTSKSGVVAWLLTINHLVRGSPVIPHKQENRRMRVQSPGSGTIPRQCDSFSSFGNSLAKLRTFGLYKSITWTAVVSDWWWTKLICYTNICR